MDDLLQEFLAETGESMETLDNEIVSLERNPNDPELLGNIFRLVHTIKGTCGFLGLPRLEAVAHASENVLGKFRDGALPVAAEAVTLIFMSLDRIKELLAALERFGEEPAGDDGELIAQLDELAAGAAASAPAEPPIAEAEPVEEEPASEAWPEGGEDEFDPGLGRNLKEGEVSLEELERIFQETPGPADSLPATEAPPPGPTGGLPSVPSDDGGPGSEAGDRPQRETASGSQTIRVNVDLLEHLMTMVSELVLTRNQLLQILRNEKESKFTVPLQRLSHVTSELQEGVMKTRMQQIGNAWAKLPRIVRDLSVELDKKIDLRMIGAETELDRQLLELIRDPLTHMVRNSADHGIEAPGERRAAGKDETGTITLNAYQEGGHIVIEVGDDGKGLAVERIREKVLAGGLATGAELASMGDSQIQQFIFRPGFSTASEVTAVSGRGVGMDVVRTNIEKIGGTVELESVAGKGSTFTIKLPLTLAIVSALIVECAGDRFAVPQIGIVELVRAGSRSEHTIEHIQGAPVLRLRDRLLPLVRLRDLLGYPAAEGAPPQDTFIVVSQVGHYRFGIVVDRVFDTEEIVVKPMASIFREIPYFSGNTILGDGQVIMILDPNGIAATTGDVAAFEQVVEVAEAEAEETNEQRITLLVFRAGDRTPKAVPLALVARLEEIDIADVEFGDGRPVVQYRGKLMPLVPVAGKADFAGKTRQPLLVFADRARSMGLMVDEIVDIVEDRLTVELGTKRPGLLGSAIVAGQAMEVIDTGYYLMQAYGDWFEPEEGFGQLSDARRRAAARVLLIDDSPFFRNLLVPVLSVAGYSVTAAEGADDALRLCAEGRNFDIIVSDIEMPGMDGFQLAETLRAGSRWSSVPLIALSAHSSPQDFERGRDAGFSEYVAKFDREGLLQALSQSLDH